MVKEILPPTAGNVPPMTRKQQIVPPRGPHGAGDGGPPTPETPPLPPSEELVKALQLLQSVLTPEDFSKYEKKLVPPKQQERVLSSVKESFLRSMRTIWRSKGRCWSLFERNWPRCGTR